MIVIVVMMIIGIVVLTSRGRNTPDPINFYPYDDP